MRARFGPRLSLAVAAAAVLLRPAAAAAQVGYTGSVYVVKIETADGTRTDAVYVFNSIDFEHGRVRGSAALPLIVERTRWIDPSLGPVETAWQSGLADPTFRIDVEAWRNRGRDTAVRVSGSIKAPLASVEDGYSSGKADVAVGVSLSTFRERNSVLADVTYWILGEPTNVVYRNVPSFYVGFARVLDHASRWSAVVSASGAPSVIPGADPPAQASVGILRVLGRGTAIGVSFDVGLTDGAADFAVSSTWRFAF